MGKRGPPPKPDKLKELAGNPGKRPMNENPPEFSPPESVVPQHLDALAQAEWKRVYGDLDRNGLITNVDRAALEYYCECYSQWRKAKDALAKIEALDPVLHGFANKGQRGGLVLNPLVRVVRDAGAAMVAAAAQFGMTPASRTSISKDPQADDNPFEEIGRQHESPYQSTH